MMISRSMDTMELLEVMPVPFHCGLKVRKLRVDLWDGELREIFGILGGIQPDHKFKLVAVQLNRGYLICLMINGITLQYLFRELRPI